jgi:hypothetical protein
VLPIEEVAIPEPGEEKHWFTFHAGRSPGGVEMNTTRRDFLKVGAGAVATTSAVSANSNEGISSIASGRSAAAPAEAAGNMIYRRFGPTDVHISAIGMGGHHLGDVPTLDEAVQLVHEAVDAGITFFDNAWEYYNGKTAVSNRSSGSLADPRHRLRQRPGVGVRQRRRPGSI